MNKSVGMQVGLLCVSLTFLTECSSSNDLSRSTALSKIRDSKEAGEPLRGQISVVLGTNSRDVQIAQSIHTNLYRILRELDIIAVADSATAIFTPLGLRRSQTEKWEKFGWDNYSRSWSYPIATKRNIQAVTGIQIQGTEAEAEFDWNWIANDIGEQLAKRPESESLVVARTFQPKKGHAYFAHYDDGWRVQRIKWE